MERLKEVMTLREASQYLGVSPDTLYKYLSEDKIPAFKLGNRWRFKKDLLDRWMERKSERALSKLLTTYGFTVARSDVQAGADGGEPVLFLFELTFFLLYELNQRCRTLQLIYSLLSFDYL